MELNKLLNKINVLKTNVDSEYQISGIKISSKQLENNNLFVCMQGSTDDGNKYIGQIDKSVVILTEKLPDIDVKYVLVEDVRKAYSIISQNWFFNPIEDMKFVAVVGTNGKTSTAHYISSILTFAGLKVGLIGTEGHYILGEKVSESLTTPDPYELNELFFKMRTKGVDVVVSEVSAHAIYLEKLCGIKADVAVLTNISQEHLDYFKNFDNYCSVKMSYFLSGNAKKAVINIDDLSGRILARKLEDVGIDCITFGIENPADCFAMDVFQNIDGVNFIANLEDNIIEVKTQLYGDFNAYNLLSAMTVARELGIDNETLTHAVKKVKAVKGRFSILNNDKGVIIIDFAHTPDGLENLLRTARTITKSRLITVFGCGGDRDKSKRKAMGEIASRLSDYVVITSDNPRSENPDDIIKDIEWGMLNVNYKCITERGEAIKFAIAEMLEGDTLVLAGKGNENYLEINGKKIPFNDFDAVGRWSYLK